MAYPDNIFNFKLNGVAINGNKLYSQLGIVPSETGHFRKLGLILDRLPEAGQTLQFTIPKRQKLKKVKSVPYITQTQAWANPFEGYKFEITFKPGYWWAASGDEMSKELFLLANSIQGHIFASRIVEKGRYEDINYVKTAKTFLDANKANNVMELLTTDLTNLDNAKAVKIYETFLEMIKKVRKVSNDITASLGTNLVPKLKVSISPDMRMALQMALFTKAINPVYILEEGEKNMVIDGVKLHTLNVFGSNITYSDLVSVDATKFHALFVVDLGENAPAIAYRGGKNYAQQTQDNLMAGLSYASFRSSEAVGVWNDIAKFCVYGIYTNTPSAK